MERLFIAFALVGVLGLASCANEGPTADELGQRLQKGVRGEGQLSPDIDRTNDPYVKTREGNPTGLRD